MAHPISDQLASITDPLERHRIKAHALAALTGQVGRSVTRVIKGVTWTLTLTSAPTFADDLLVFSVQIKRNNKDVTPADLNPIRVCNPPILVDDPMGDIVRTWIDPETGATQTRTLREDLPAALLGIIRELAKG